MLVEGLALNFVLGLDGDGLAILDALEKRFKLLGSKFCSSRCLSIDLFSHSFSFLVLLSN
jgi:hypothetical protein